MDIQHLRYFTEVAKLGSFTRASFSLHVSQPALSKSVRNIEDTIGVELFDRKNKAIVLTDCGECLLEAAQNVIIQFDSITESLNDIMNLQKGKIIVGIPPVIGTTYFAPIITGFKGFHPGVDMTIVEEGAKTVVAEVSEDHIDIGIVISPVNTDELNIIPVMDDENVVVVHTLNPLATRQYVSFEDLANESLCLLNEKFMLYDQIIANCNRVGFEPKIAITSSQWDFIMELVSLNYGISILPKPIAIKASFENIKILPLSPVFPWKIIMIAKKGRYFSYAMREFIHFVQTSFQQFVSPVLSL